MNDKRTEEIIAATLELAAENGLKSVSMNMIADKIGIKKPSLYNHFSSKQELVQACYEFLREKAKQATAISSIDYGALCKDKTAEEVLKTAVNGYILLTSQQEMRAFYKIIYSERCFEPMAAKILVEETEKMIVATKQLFYALEVHKKLHFSDIDMSARFFALNVHALTDYTEDKKLSDLNSDEKTAKNAINEYIDWFCKENAVKK